MDKKLIKIVVVFLVIGISVPMIVTAANNQEDFLTLFINKKPELQTSFPPYEELSDNNPSNKLTDIDTIPDSNFNIFGKWGIYDSTAEGAFKGYEEKDSIYGKTWYNNQKAYFYIQMNKHTHNFKGIVIFNDNFYNVNGNYLKKDGKFIAMWATDYIEGWMAGEII